METCVRGFSFMANNSVKDLQYIEGDELERTWKSTRRERMKQREQKIWDEFVKEQDVLRTACKDDPYQFLEQLPEACLKELMDTELQKMRKEVNKAKEEEQGNGDISPSREEELQTCVVTFAEDTEKGECNMFHIFDDDIEKDEELSGPEDEALNDSPCTVREGLSRVDGHLSSDRLEKTSSKSSENVTNVIESSIYCAKLKDLRLKINEELLAMMCSLERQDILSIPPEEVARLCKRSAEFSSRFNRIYMYQLQRQMHDIQRNNSVMLPFAKHTQFQSQMARIVSLHQNLLQSCQVFHKSLEQTCCVGESARALLALAAAARDSTSVCRDVPPPKDFAAARDLYTDELLLTCDKVDEAVNEHAVRCSEILNSTDLKCSKTQKKSAKGRGKKKINGACAKSGSKTDTEARLSMYSLETLRINLNPNSTRPKDIHSGGTSKMRLHLNGVSASKHGKSDKNDGPTKSQRKSPRSRRPLMRDPHAGRPRAPRPARDTDIRTMVEAVETCTSSHMSREPSPKSSARRSHDVTPRSVCTQRDTSPRTSKVRDVNTPKKYQQSPLLLNRIQSPKTRLRNSPKSKNILKTALTSIKSDPIENLDSSRVQITPVSKIQCAKKKENKEISKKDDNLSKQSHNERDKHDADYTDVQRKDINNKNDQKYKKYNMGFEIKDSENNTLKEDHTNSNREEKSESQKVVSPKSAPSKHSHKSSDEVVHETKTGNDWTKISNIAPARCEVTRLLKQLCSGDGSRSRTERVVGAKNAQLLCISGNSPRQPSTPQLLRILEETIQKKVPKPLFQKASTTPRDLDRYRLVFNIAEKTADNLFQYRTKYVQHMLTSPMYANSAIGKPWEMVGSLSEHIIDDILLSCVKEMELQEVIQELYKLESS